MVVIPRGIFLEIQGVYYWENPFRACKRENYKRITIKVNTKDAKTLNTI